MFLLLLLLLLGVLLLLPAFRQWLLERAKDASDVGISFLLRGGSQFESDLNREGSEEQEMWRSQRLRDLRNRRPGRGTR
ncbi:MAG: hypothetical protein HYX74_01630 [Acidobacteria bacterium]|nr:hypothetical protein [Acidobacteriota bacterium]